MTGVTETNVRTFASNWTGTGTIAGSGDAETISLTEEQNMVSEVVNTGTVTVQLLINVYAAGDTVTVKYRHGATQVACEAAEWTDYVTPFASLGYVQARLES